MVTMEGRPFCRKQRALFAPGKKITRQQRRCDNRNGTIGRLKLQIADNRKLMKGRHNVSQYGDNAMTVGPEDAQVVQGFGMVERQFDYRNDQMIKYSALTRLFRV
ncbi:MAG: hypothetical protein ACLSE6_01700 [Alphaproteobacteria bacterium]